MSSRQIEAGRAIVLIGLDHKGFNTSIADLSKKLRAIGRTAMQVGAAMSGAGVGMFAGFAGLTKIVADIETSSRRFDLIFGESAAAMRSELGKLSDKTGVAMTSLEQQASTFGAVFADIRAGVGESNFVDVVAKTQEVMLDLAAIGGISIPEAAERLKSAFTSTGESVDQYGFNLRKANLEAEAARQGIKQSVLTMSEQQKQLLKLSIFMRTTTVTGVKFVDMVDTLNGQFTLLRANLLELTVKFGSLISAAFVPVLRFANKLVIALRPIAGLLSPLAVAIAPIAGVLVTVGTAMFSIGLASRLLLYSMGGFGRAARFILDLKWAVRQLRLAMVHIYVSTLPQFLAMGPQIKQAATVAVVALRLLSAAILDVLKIFALEAITWIKHASKAKVLVAAWTWLSSAVMFAVTTLRAYLVSTYLTMASSPLFIKVIGGIAAAWTRVAAAVATATAATWAYVRAAIAAALAAMGPVSAILAVIAGAVVGGVALANATRGSGEEQDEPEKIDLTPRKPGAWSSPVHKLRRRAWEINVKEPAEAAARAAATTSEGMFTASAFRGDISRQLAAPSGSTAADRTADSVDELKKLWKGIIDPGANAVRTV